MHYINIRILHIDICVYNDNPQNYPPKECSYSINSLISSLKKLIQWKTSAPS